MKNTSTQVYQLVTLLVLLLFVNCQKEEITKELQTENKEQISNRNVVSAGDIPEVMEFLRSKSNDKLEFKFNSNKTNTYTSTSDPHESDIVITQAMEDQIVQVIQDGKSNYAFKTKEKFPNYFLNLIVVQTISGYYMYFAKYVPSIETNWDGNSLDTFEGVQYVYSDSGKFRKKYYYSNGIRKMIPCECPTGEEEGDGGGDGDGCQTELWWICNTFGYLHRDFMQCNCVQQENCTGFIPISIEVCDGINPTTIESSEINLTASQECYCWVDEGSTDGSGGGTGGGNNNNCPNAQPCANELEELNEFCECEFAINPITPINSSPNMAKNINICLGTDFNVNTLNANPTIDQLYNYMAFDDFGNCNPENPEFAELAAEALLDGGEFDEDDNVVLSSEFKNNQKLKCVYDKLAGDESLLFKETIATFIDNPNVNLIFTIGNCVSTDVACTQDEYLEETGIITVTIEDIGLNPIELAQTILHEAIHAEIAKYVSEFVSGVDSNNRSYLFQLYAYYKDWSDSIDPNFNWDNAADHQYMITNYVNKIASALRQFDNNRYTIDYYKDYAWDGLRDNYNYNGTLSDSDAAYYASLRSVTNSGIEVCDY